MHWLAVSTATTAIDRAWATYAQSVHNSCVLFSNCCGFTLYATAGVITRPVGTCGCRLTAVHTDEGAGRKPASLHLTPYKQVVWMQHRRSQHTCWNVGAPSRRCNEDPGMYTLEEHEQLGVYTVVILR